MKQLSQQQNLPSQKDNLPNPDHLEEDVSEPMEVQAQESPQIYCEDSQQQPQQQNQQEEQNQYGQYDEYGGQQMIFIEDNMNSYDQRIPSQSNTQCEMEDLVKIIQKEVQKVMELTGFDRNWALVYYHTCGWKADLVSMFVDEKLSCRQMISYIQKKAKILNLSGTCDVCCLDEQIIFSNMCGDEFCEKCWKSHLKEKLTTFNTDPFPPCLNSQCQIKTSPFILEQCSKTSKKLKKLYLRTLCRSYAIGNTSVKMCKGREKFSCDRCFKVNKLMDMIECECCGNFVCGRCGEEYHYPSQCFEGPNWRKIVEEATNFVDNLNYRICPNCKEAVERSVGCNSMVCKCKQTFCYICGEKWLPNHSQHGVCYKEKEIRALNQERKKKHQNQKEYTDKLEKYKAEIDKYLSKMRMVDEVNIEKTRDELIKRFKILSNELDYLQPLKKKLKICLMMGKNYVISYYFTSNQILKAELSNLKPLIESSYDYFVYVLKNLILADGGEGVMTVEATEMRKNIQLGKLNPKDVLVQGKMNMLGVMKKMEKYLVG